MSSNRSSISVVLPTYNRAHLLPRALASVAAQTHPVDEVIVVDDASTDGTREVVVRSTTSNVRYLRHDRNRGGAAARNTGIRAASGDWIAFLDSDDAWLPTKLAVQMRTLAERPEARACTSADVVLRPGRDPERRFTGYSDDDLARSLLHTYVGVTSSFVVARSALEQVGGFDPSLASCQDWDLLLRLVRSHPVVHVQTPLVRIHASADEPGITRGNPDYVSGIERFHEKHEADIHDAGKRAVAVHAFRMGQAYALSGTMDDARDAFRRAMTYRPWRSRLVVHWFATFAGPTTYRTLVEWRRRYASSIAPASGLPDDVDG